MEIILHLFQFGWFLYHFLTYLFWLELAVLCWIELVNCNCLIPDLRGKAFSHSSLSMILAVSFSYVAFIMLRMSSCIPCLLSVFIMKGCWILSKVFSASMGVIMCLFPLFKKMWCIALIDFYRPHHSSTLKMNLSWSYCVILLICLLLLFSR